jgi:hypothetical protein
VGGPCCGDRRAEGSNNGRRGTGKGARSSVATGAMWNGAAGSSCSSGARGSAAMGACVERGGMGGPAVGKGQCGSSCGGRGTGGGAWAAWNLHAAAALGFNPARGLGGKWKCVRSVRRETGGQLVVQRLEKIRVPRCVPTANEI